MLRLHDHVEAISALGEHVTMSYEEATKGTGRQYMKGQIARRIVTASVIPKRSSTRMNQRWKKLYGQRIDTLDSRWNYISFIFLVHCFSTLFCIFSAWPFSSKPIKELKWPRKQGRHEHGIKLLKLLVLVLIWRNGQA
jgi:hypothetical protein